VTFGVYRRIIALDGGIVFGGVIDDSVGLFLESICLGFDWRSCNRRIDELGRVALMPVNSGVA
jgi:hypothetical protein